MLTKIIAPPVPVRFATAKRLMSFGVGHDAVGAAESWRNEEGRMASPAC